MKGQVYILLLRVAPVAIVLVLIQLAESLRWVGFALVRPAFAQVPPRQLPGAVEPGRERPLPEAPAQPKFDFSIEAPQRSPVPRAVDEVHFLLTDIRIIGAKTLPPESFRPLYAGMIGKQVTLTDILDVADRIEDSYRRAGFILTRAYVPPQRVGDGIFTIDVIEGYVAAVSVDGGGEAMQRRIKAYLQSVLASRPLEVGTIERALLLTNDLPGVAASGVLRPSPNALGASDLVVNVVETPVSGGLALDNRGSRFSGVWTLGGDVEFNSLIDAGDQLAASVAMAPDDPSERILGQARYRYPIGEDGAMASMIVTVSRGAPGLTLQQLQVLTDSIAVGPRFSYPILRTRDESLLLDTGITVQDATVNLLGQQFSHDQWRVFDIGASYLRNGFLGGSWTALFDIAQGLPFFGATSNDSPELSVPEAHTDFTKLTVNLHHTRSLVGPISLALWLQGQYAFERVVDGEQVTFGGTQIGRGYDPAAITGDRGLGVSAELRYDTRLPDIKIELLQPYLFFDAARVWEIHSTGGADERLASTGAGIRVGLPHDITAGIEFAQQLRAVPGSDEGKRSAKVLVDAAVRF
ncbi:MAG TPA: ShlB/FhaC/HecB family hemolysin secretion/activation protein [Stellaceae bacterium]|nr:ShlB/FhaC/HecB family hemolysin secretion/activation protein [Stellaceae bacterium]